ncbi:hypothetical protein HHA04nite_08380 [Halomonas halophila]|uniref:EAL domain-containing protein n=1 Tax=Halomonas halophila TaxID=29573 RepID=A0ABQ0U167_9GAMM|nr:hypothetical protein HHA04nite_08380 [Halomonas halophila]
MTVQAADHRDHLLGERLVVVPFLEDGIEGLLTHVGPLRGVEIREALSEAKHQGAIAGWSQTL